MTTLDTFIPEEGMSMHDFLDKAEKLFNPKPMFLISRKEDGKTIKGSTLTWIAQEENTVKAYPEIGLQRRLFIDLIDPAFFKWMTTEVEEVITDTPELTIFKTKNSTYTITTIPLED